MVKKQLVSTGDRVFSGCVYGVLILFGLVCLFPMMYVISISLTPYEEYLRHGGMVFFPQKMTLENFGTSRILPSALRSRFCRLYWALPSILRLPF